MKKLEDWAVPILFVVLTIGYFFSQRAINREIDEKTKVYKSKLGEQFILEKDTLTIIDYNSFRGVFILSDGREINFDMVK